MCHNYSLRITEFVPSYEHCIAEQTFHNEEHCIALHGLDRCQPVGHTVQLQDSNKGRDWNGKETSPDSPNEHPGSSSFGLSVNIYELSQQDAIEQFSWKA